MVRLPSLNALRAFEAVARLGSVSLAGVELSVTPGAVSRHIKELENDLGVTTLERDGRGVRLTVDGKRLRNNLKPAFEMTAPSTERSCERAATRAAGGCWSWYRRSSRRIG